MTSGRIASMLVHEHGRGAVNVQVEDHDGPTPSTVVSASETVLSGQIWRAARTPSSVWAAQARPAAAASARPWPVTVWIFVLAQITPKTRGNPTTVPPPKELYSFCSHPTA